MLFKHPGHDSITQHQQMLQSLGSPTEIREPLAATGTIRNRWIGARMLNAAVRTIEEGRIADEVSMHASNEQRNFDRRVPTHIAIGVIASTAVIADAISSHGIL